MSAHYGDPDSEHRHTPRAKTHSIPMEVLDDIASRFIINESDHVKEDLIRMCFQVSHPICFVFLPKSSPVV